ncbi:hypothetical protein J4G07_17030 [Candidatus Poribacteria bacterium]|nr:hypothetical protein [Candidatus Poribacteria bacterium]
MLFIIFVIFTPIVVWFVLHFMSKRKAAEEVPEPGALMEICAICQNEFTMNELLEKEVGGYGRVYCFCGQCIENLSNEYQDKTDTITGE